MALQKVAIRQGDKFGPEYTALMKATVPGIVVLGDDLPLKSGLIGWWAKLEIFSPWYADLRPCVVFDLDTYILDPTAVDDLSGMPDDLHLINDFNRPHMPESGIFIAPSDADEIWARVPSAKVSHRGDGPFLGSFWHKRINDTFHGLRSYKKHQLYDDPKDARIVCFHGKPKPHECGGWAGEFWNSRTSRTKN